MHSSNYDPHILRHNTSFLLFSLLNALRTELLHAKQPERKIDICGVIGACVSALEALVEGLCGPDPRMFAYCPSDDVQRLTKIAVGQNGSDTISFANLIALIDGVTTALQTHDARATTLARRAIEACAQLLGLAYPAPNMDIVQVGSGSEPQFTLVQLPPVPIRPGRHASKPVAKLDCQEGDLLSQLFSQMFTIEFPASEVCAAMCLKFQEELPIELDLLLGQQTYEEGRHAMLVKGAFERLGGSIEDFDPCFDIWDNFLIGKSLAETLCIEHFLGEGYALGGDYMMADQQHGLGRYDLEAIFLSLQADEILHVKNGLDWFRRLAGEDAQYLIARLEQQVAVPPPPEPWFGADLRRSVGFTESEIRQQKLFSQSLSL